MDLIGRAVNAMRLARIHHQTELLVRLNECLNHLNAVLKVDIVVARSMHQQQRAMQFAGYVTQPQIPVSFAVFTRQPKIAFRINRIVVPPIGYRRHRYSRGEPLGMHHGVQSHRSAIAPSPYSHAVAIELRIAVKQLIERGQLVAEFDSAVLVADGSLKFPVASRSASVVHGKNRKAFLRQQFVK